MLVNGKRSLAHIEKVTNIRCIEGADNIEQCNVLGWNLICHKNEFKENDLCVYIEIDSKVPDREEFEFLRNKSFKVKTMKLGKFGVISQGLALSVSMFKELNGLSENTDVTKLLGIKYAVEEDNVRKSDGVNFDAKFSSMKSRHKVFFSNSIVKKLMKHKLFRKLVFIFLGTKKDNPKTFPSKFEFVHKTDEERIENIPNMLKNKQELIATEKLDGTSTTFIMERIKENTNKYRFYVCSRNVCMVDQNQSCYHDHNIYWDMAFKYNIKEVLTRFMNATSISYCCIQGESVGSVQGNPLKLKEDEFYAFNFITSDDGRWSSEKAKLLLNEWSIKFVPILSTSFILPDTMEEMKELATGKSVLNPDVLREGIVYRCAQDNSVSFKNVSKEYLLKHNQ